MQPRSVLLAAICALAVLSSQIGGAHASLRGLLANSTEASCANIKIDKYYYFVVSSSMCNTVSKGRGRSTKP